MLHALLNVPAKILLSIAGALFALNFATYATMKYQSPNHELIALESGLRCGTQDIHLHELEVAESRAHLIQEEARLKAEQARLLTLQGLLNDSAVDAEVAEMRRRIEELRAEGSELRSQVRVIKVN